MDEQELHEIRQRCESATPGPWESPFGSYVVPPFEFKYKVAQLGGKRSSPGLIAREDDKLESDSYFIAHARTDIPALLDEIERLKSEIERLESEQHMESKGTNYPPY